MLYKLGPAYPCTFTLGVTTWRGYATHYCDSTHRVQVYADGLPGHEGKYDSGQWGPHCWLLPGDSGWRGTRLTQFLRRLAGQTHVTTAPTPYYLSQKATGIAQLTLNHYRHFSAPTAHCYPQSKAISFPVFARPCPTVPRHGFVDSRLVHTQDEFNGVIREIEKTGEPVEIICMPFLQSDYSGIITPAGITYGLGHDGATSGTSAAYIPAPTGVREFIAQFHAPLEKFGIAAPDVPYGEFVGQYANKRPTIVQMRGGPAISGTTRYVPTAMTVQNIVVAEGDLLDWETKVKTLPEGTVVWHPNGALSSHYAVHCILHEIPIVCDQSPSVGETLKPESTVPKPTRDHYTTLAQYLAHALGTPLHDPREAQLKAAVASLHAQGLWGGENHLLVLRAEGAAHMFRYAVAAVFGELRHYNCHGPGGGCRTPIQWQSCEEYHRDFVFTKIYRHNIRAILEALPLVVADYEAIGWGGAYGGKKWADCAKAVLALGLGIQRFLHAKNAKSWAKVVEGWNQTVNAVHNGGGLLTKHLESSFLDEVARNPQIGLITGDVAKLVLTCGDYPRNLKPGKVLPKRSTLPALTLYPFDDALPGYNTTLHGSEDKLTGCYQAVLSNSGIASGYCNLVFPHVGNTKAPGRPYSMDVYRSKYPYLSEVARGVVTVWLVRGTIWKIKDHTGALHTH